MTGDLASVCYRTQARLEAAPPTTALETKAVAVEPLLAALGWETPAGTRALEGVTLEWYAIDGVPALGVAVEGYANPLEETRWTAIRQELSRLGVPNGLYSNGRTVRLVTGGETHELELLALAADGPLASLSRAAVAETHEPSPADRAAGRLAVRREALQESLTAELVATAGVDPDGTLERAVGVFLDRLVAHLTGGDPPADAAETETREDTRRSAAERTNPEVPIEEPTGEYVAKFFDGSATVGGIGDERSSVALVHGVEFLLERGLAGLSLPWAPEGEEPVALARGETSAMTAPRELSNGLVLEVGGSVADRARRLEALADRAGMRVMLTGDWSGQ